MAKCPDKGSPAYKELEAIVGEGKAHFLWNKYDGEVPRKEYIKGESEYSLPQDVAHIIEDSEAYMTSLSAGEEAMQKFEMDQELRDKKVNAAIDKLKQDKQNLWGLITKNPEREDELRERIEQVEEEINLLASDESVLADILDVVDRSQKWVNTNVFDKERLNDSDIIQAMEELSNLRIIISNLLEIDDVDDKGQSIYVIQNKALTDRAEKKLNSLTLAQDRVSKLALKYLADKVSDKKGELVTVEDIQRYKDIRVETSLVMDLSRVDDKMANYISKILARSDRSRISEFSEGLTIPLRALEKKAGMKLYKEEDAKQFLQQDKDGNYTHNLLDEYSTEYWEEYKKVKDKVRNLRHRMVNLKEFQLKDDINKEIRDFLNETMIVDIAKFDETVDEAIQNKERVRLEAEFGKVKADEMIEAAKVKLERYEKAKDSYFRTQFLKKQRGEINEEQYLNILENYERSRDPRMIFKNLNDPKKVFKDINFSFISFSPKMSKTSWHDSKFLKLKGDGTNAKYQLYRFIIDKLREYKSYLPWTETAGLGHNYLPEIFKESLLDDLKGGLGKGAFANSLMKMISAMDDGVVDKNLIGADGQPKKSIPIRFTADQVGKLARKVEKLENNIVNTQEHITDMKRSLANLNKIEGGIRVRDAHENFKQQAIDLELAIEASEKKLEALKIELPEFKAKYKKMADKKSLDISQALQMFGMMAINYKHKAMVEDSVLLAKKAVTEALVTKTNALGKVKTDKSGKPLTEAGTSDLLKQINHTIDALLYGVYKNDGSVTKRKVGKTPEARAQLRILRKRRNKLKADYRSGKLKESVFMEQMEQLENDMEEIEASGNVGIGQVVDSVMKYSYITGLGWNPLSATANVLYGKMANSIEAASGQFFTISDKRQAEKLLRASVKRSMTGAETETSKKIRNLVAKYGIMFDLLEDSYGSNRGLSEKRKRLGFLLPLEMQRRGEYYNQGTVLLAMLINKKVKTKDGKEISLFDAYDSNAEIKNNLLENPDVWGRVEGAKENEFTKMQDRVIQLNKRLHGNYDPASPMMAKRTALGRSLMMFKSWMPEGFATRFEKMKYDPMLEDYIEGRWRTYLTLGFGGSVKSLYKIFAQQMIKKGTDKGDLKMSKTQFENMKRNLREIQWGLVMLSLYLLAKLGLDDEDEDTTGVKLALNMLGRMQTDITMYMNPGELTKMAQNPTPVLGTLNNIMKVPLVVFNYTTSDHPSHDNDYFVRNISKLFPLGTQVAKIAYLE